MTTTFNSNQYADQIASSRSNEPGHLKTLYYEGVTATADTGTITVIKLPPGKIRILPKLCGFMCENMANDANLTIGVGAYTASNGTAVTANVNALVDTDLVNAHTAIANINTNWSLPANGGLDIDSMQGVEVTVTVADANTVAAATYSGYVTFLSVK